MKRKLAPRPVTDELDLFVTQMAASLGVSKNEVVRSALRAMQQRYESGTPVIVGSLITGKNVSYQL